MAGRQSKFAKSLRRLDQTLSKWIAPVSFVIALILAISVGIPTGVDIYQSWANLEAKERAKTGIELIQLMATIVGGVAIFWNIVIARRQLAASQEQSVTERFSKAVEQLGHEQLSVRVGAIYSLGRIARDSPRDNWSIMEILSVFVRERRGLPPGERLAQKPLTIDRDVQAAVIVIGRRDTTCDLESEPLFLNYTDFRKISFAEDNFYNIRFHCSDFREANFYAANLEKTKFWRSCLMKAVLFKANLRDADLVEADLREADMRECILTGADIKKANLEGARHLTVEQVKSAKNWQEAIYDNKFLILLSSQAIN